MSTDEDVLLTTTEVVTELKVARSTLYRWVDEGRLTAIKLGPRAVRFRRSEIDRFIERAAS